MAKRKMHSLVLILWAALSISSLAQNRATNQKPSVPQGNSDRQELKTTEARYYLGKYEIVIRQTKRIKEPKQTQVDAGARPYWCSASLEIREKGKIIRNLEFDELLPLGWHYGIHLPLRQESRKHLIFMKYGNYNSRVLVISENGHLYNIGGDCYRIFLDRFLVARGAFADDTSAYSIFDLSANKLLRTVNWRDLKDAIQSPPADGKAQILKLYSRESELFVSADLVKEDNLETVGHLGHFYKIDLKTGNIEKAVFEEKEYRELIFDFSNIDMRNDCECTKTVGHSGDKE
jgi:hypothetical protein